MTTKNPQQLSDDELWQFCRAESLRAGKYAYGGCVLTLGTMIAAFAVAMFLRPSLLPESLFIGPFIGLGFALVVYFSLNNLARYRYPKYFTEWNRRKQQRMMGNEPISPRAAARLFEGVNPPDWILLFSGKGLPSGNTVWTNIYLKVSPPSGDIITATAPLIEFETAENALNRIDGGRGGLVQGDAERLCDILSASDPALLKNVELSVRDGFPCSLSILRREPRLTHTISANLCSIAPPDNPTIKLMTFVSELKPEA